ncbi:MAG: cupin domain-containing protein [Pirellulales bacterium]|nr:cupin domain-containing protein [Pirellulales bacterium]
MKVTPAEAVKLQEVVMPGAERCQVRWLVDEDDGAPNFAMRQFEVAAGGYTPRHNHPYEHEVFVLAGQGVVMEGDKEHTLTPGTVVYIPPDEVHQFRNTGADPLRFLCLVPNSANTKAATVAPECGSIEQ